MEEKRKRGVKYYTELLDLVVSSGTVTKDTFESYVKKCDQNVGITGTSNAAYYYIKNKLMDYADVYWISVGRNFGIDPSHRDEVAANIVGGKKNKSEKKEGTVIAPTLLPADKAFRDYILKRARELEGTQSGRPSKESIREVKKALGRRPTKDSVGNIYKILHKASLNMGRVSLGYCAEVFGWESFAVMQMDHYRDILERYGVSLVYKVSELSKSVTLDFIKTSETLDKLENLSMELYGISQKEKYRDKGQKKILVPRAPEDEPSVAAISDGDRFIAYVALGMCELNNGNSVSLAEVLKVLRDNTFMQVYENSRDLVKILKKFSFICSDVSIFRAGNKEEILKNLKELKITIATTQNKTYQKLSDLGAKEVYSYGDVKLVEITLLDTLHTISDLAEIWKYGQFEDGTEKIISNQEIEERIKSFIELEKSRRFKPQSDSYKADIVLWNIERCLV